MSNYDEQTFKAICLGGDYNQIIAYLESQEDTKQLIEKYKDVFEKSTYILGLEDEKISDVLRAYEDYLKWLFTTKPSKITAARRFYMMLIKFIIKTPRAIFSKKPFEKYFKLKGYYANVGMVAPYFEVSLWHKQVNQIVSVEIPDGMVDVNLCSMEDVITRGWLDYLSFGKTGTGGWATKKAICYFSSVYEKDHDEFQLSLLKHEAQHVYDKRKYPKMKTIDLEYRAKLVELIYHTKMDTFFYFMRTMGNDKRNPHMYASSQIIKGLSQKIFGKELETDHSLWNAERANISAASLELLKEHSKRIESCKGKRSTF